MFVFEEPVRVVERKRAKVWGDRHWHFFVFQLMFVAFAIVFNAIEYNRTRNKHELLHKLLMFFIASIIETRLRAESMPITLGQKGHFCRPIVIEAALLAMHGIAFGRDPGLPDSARMTLETFAGCNNKKKQYW